MVRFDLGPLLQGKTRIAKFKIAYNSLTIVPRVLQCENNQKEIITWKICDVVKFDIGPSIAKLKSAYNLLIISPRGLKCETNL